MRGAHAGHGRLFCGDLLGGGLVREEFIGEEAASGKIMSVEVAAGKNFGTEGHFQEIIVPGSVEDHYLLIDLLAGWQGIRYRSLI